MRKEQPGVTIKSVQKVHLTPYEIAKFASQMEALAFGEFLHELGIMFSHWGENQHSFLTKALAHTYKIPKQEDRSQFLSSEDHAYGVEFIEKLREAASWVEMMDQFDALEEQLEAAETKQPSAYDNAKWAVKQDG